MRTRFSIHYAIRTTLLLCLCGIAGCTTEVQPTHANTTGEGIANARAHNEAAEINVQHAVPHTDPIGNEFLDAASNEHGKVEQVLSQAQADNAAKSKLIGELQQSNAVKANTIETYRHRWIGDRTFFWGRMIVGAAITGWFVLGIGGTLLTAFVPGGLWFSVGKAILSALPLANPFATLSRRLQS
ncbi:MAG: hypothetical protein IT541_09650 [Hyphomicrobiales bacterium]|jgi:hypothetical protein|nr:hypothetical protein [Hyphomicrobiales bacterium]